jgi:hypothetical protein
VRYVAEYFVQNRAILNRIVGEHALVLPELWLAAEAQPAALAVNGCNAKEMMQVATNRPRTVMRYIVGFVILFIVLVSLLEQSLF